MYVDNPEYITSDSLREWYKSDRKPHVIVPSEHSPVPCDQIYIPRGLWTVIRAAKSSSYGHREYLKSYMYQGTGHSKAYLTKRLCARMFTLYKLKTVADWNALVAKVGNTIFNQGHTSWHTLYIDKRQARKEHFRVIIKNERPELQYKSWDRNYTNDVIKRKVVEKEEKTIRKSLWHRMYIKDEYKKVMAYEKEERRKKHNKKLSKLRKEVKDIKLLTNELKGALK